MTLSLGVRGSGTDRIICEVPDQTVELGRVSGFVWDGGKAWEDIDNDDDNDNNKK